MKRFRVLAVAVVLLLTVAACSGSDESGGAVEPAATPAATEADTPTTTEADTPVATEADDGGGNIDPGPRVLSEDDCLQAAPAIAVAFSRGFGHLAEPGDVEDAFGQLARSAPSDIAADLQLVGSTLTTFYTALRGLGVENLGRALEVTDPAVAQQIAKAAEELNTDAFTAAADNVDAWLSRNCDTG